MLKTVLLSAFLFGWTASLSPAHAQSAGAASSSSARPTYDATAPADPPQAPIEIHVDQDCRILPDPNQAGTPGAKLPRPRRDSVICHLEGVKHSEHVEETTISGKPHQFTVSVQEQEYVLQNVNSEPAIFIVEQLVRPDWAIDSDPPAIQMVPPPTGTSGQIALFRANVLPHQIVRMHVGMRHNWLKKPKQASSPASGQTNTPPPANP